MVPNETPSDIDVRAPVVSRHGAVIYAPLEALWRLHTDIDAWPTWQTDIEVAHLTGPFAPGSTFTWRSGGLDVESTIYRVEPGRRTLWGGPARGIEGVHSWTLVPAESGTRVDTAESWSGEPIEADRAAMQAVLDRSLVSWLRLLKAAAEGDPQPPDKP